jgi:hypothetical protein
MTKFRIIILFLNGKLKISCGIVIAWWENGQKTYIVPMTNIFSTKLFTKSVDEKKEIFIDVCQNG